jgi:hypothetical protein
MVYYAKPAALATTSTNTILTNYYTAYLEGALKFAFSYMRDFPKVQIAQSALDAFLDNANQKNKSIHIGSMMVVAE